MKVTFDLSPTEVSIARDALYRTSSPPHAPMFLLNKLKEALPPLPKVGDVYGFLEKRIGQRGKATHNCYQIVAINHEDTGGVIIRRMNDNGKGKAGTTLYTSMSKILSDLDSGMCVLADKNHDFMISVDEARRVARAIVEDPDIPTFDPQRMYWEDNG